MISCKKFPFDKNSKFPTKSPCKTLYKNLLWYPQIFMIKTKKNQPFNIFIINIILISFGCKIKSIVNRFEKKKKKHSVK